MRRRLHPGVTYCSNHRATSALLPPMADMRPLKWHSPINRVPALPTMPPTTEAPVAVTEVVPSAPLLWMAPPVLLPCPAGPPIEGALATAAMLTTAADAPIVVLDADMPRTGHQQEPKLVPLAAANVIVVHPGVGVMRPSAEIGAVTVSMWPFCAAGIRDFRRPDLPPRLLCGPAAHGACSIALCCAHQGGPSLRVGGPSALTQVRPPGCLSTCRLPFLKAVPSSAAQRRTAVR